MSSPSWDSIFIATIDTASANVAARKTAVIAVDVVVRAVAVLLVVVVLPLCLALSAGLAKSF